MQAYAQNTPEWLEMRKKHVGASDAPIIMEVSPWKTPYQLWEEKIGISSGNIKSSAMKRGIEMEDSARESFENETGLIVVPHVMKHKVHHFMIASLDGIDFAQKNIVEIKCPGKADHQCALDGEIPEKYIPQLQHQMEVCDLDKAYYYSYDGKKGKILEIYRDKNYIEELVEKEMKFWNCVQEFKAPNLNEKDFVERNDEVWSNYAKKWQECKQILSDLEEQEEELRQNLIHLANGKRTKGEGVFLCPNVRKGGIDYSEIPELREIDLESYRKKPIESWRIGRY